MIKKVRESKKFTQEQMSRYLDVSLRHYQNIESYKAIPSVIIGYKISVLLDVDISMLWHTFL